MADTRASARYIAIHARLRKLTKAVYMTGTTRSSDGLDPRAKKALLRSWRRGIREMDLIMGRFADAQIATLNEQEIEQYEHLLDVPDIDLFSFMTGERSAPADVDTPLFRRIVAFSRSQGLAFPQ